MKKANPVLGMMLIMVLFFTSLSFSDQNIVCIDPGHGGPGASKYGPNGDEYGTSGPVLHLSEQWVNLQVALICSTFLDDTGQFYNIVMTRRTKQAKEMLARFLKMIKLS